MARTLYFVIGGLCFGLVLIIAVELTLGSSDVPTAPMVSAPQEASPAAQDPSANATAEVSAILDRPVFSSSRLSNQSAGPISPAPAGAGSPGLKNRLAGVVIGPEKLREAVFAGDDEKTMTVKEGEEIDGWTIASIEPDRVVLRSVFGERVIEPTGSNGNGVRPRNPRRPVVGAANAAAIPQRPPQASALANAPPSPGPSTTTIRTPAQRRWSPDGASPSAQQSRTP